MVMTLVGGIGLFMLGMTLLTEGLQSLAGGALRRVLERFTRGRVSAVLTGLATTAVLQSSSATTLVTIGFVNARLLSLERALGLIFGANVGTTTTAWLVALIGLQVKVDALALPMIALGAFLKLLARGRAQATGTALAGFGLLFVGVSMLQEGMGGYTGALDLGALSAGSLLGRLALVAAGIVVTMIVQSSSAALAATLAALHAGAIGLEETVCLAIGQNIGTTITALLGSIGGSAAARQAALGHVMFNVGTGIGVFAALPLVFPVLRAAAGDGVDPTTCLSAFHTGFNVLGVLVFAPCTAPFARFLERLVPDRAPKLVRRLDRALLRSPREAIEAARRTVLGLLLPVVEVARRLVGGEAPRPDDGELFTRAEEALEEVGGYLADVHTAPTDAALYGRHVGILHALDHVLRLVEACREAEDPTLDPHEPGLSPVRERVVQELGPVVAWLVDAGGVGGAEVGVGQARARALSAFVAETRKRDRLLLLERTARGDASPLEAERVLEAMRWVDRLIYHIWRALAHLDEEPDPGASRRPPLAT